MMHFYNFNAQKVQRAGRCLVIINEEIKDYCVRDYPMALWVLTVTIIIASFQIIYLICI